MLTLAMDDALTQLQRAFADAVLFDHAPIPATIRDASGQAHASRFSVYRNNVFAGLINAIGARYPVVKSLLWDEGFNRIAQLYITAQPPRSPVLLEYGESFPQFLRSIGQSVSADYLADVAELESARTRAYHAADATPVDRDAFGRLAPDAIPGLRLALHPSVQLLKSRFPVVSIWEANRHANDNALNLWQPECALIARSRLEVEVRRLTPGAYEFLFALANGCSVGEAIDRGIADDPKFDLAECFKTLISANVTVDLKHDDSCTLSTA
jgi:hypothetical protein